MNARWEALRKAAQALDVSLQVPIWGHSVGESWSQEHDDLRAALAALEEPAPPKLRSHRCIDDGGDGYECPGCNTSNAGTPHTKPAPSEAPDREALVAEVAALRAEVERLRAIPRMPTHGKHYNPEAGTCSYCHGIGACPECWGRVGIDRAEATAGEWKESARIAADAHRKEGDRAIAAEAALATERARREYDNAEWDAQHKRQWEKNNQLSEALATERARAPEAGGFEGHPPGVCLEHGRFRLEGSGLIDTEGPLSLCTGCGQLPPHAGCRAICAACAPPNGTCYCAGCQVAGKASPPPAPAPQGEERKPCADGNHHPHSRGILGGWYCSRCHFMDYGDGWEDPLRAPRAEEGT